MIQVYSFQFSAAHFYNQTQWTPEKNRQVFGSCYDPHGHGHNYKLEVGFSTQTPNDNLLLKETIRLIVSKLDHHHLNFEIPEFKTKIPTTENIASYIAEKITKSQPEVRLSFVKLFEMPDLWAEVRFD